MIDPELRPYLDRLDLADRLAAIDAGVLPPDDHETHDRLHHAYDRATVKDWTWAERARAEELERIRVGVYAGGCMEPWAAVSLDDPSDKALIPCGTCPACRASDHVPAQPASPGPDAPPRAHDRAGGDPRQGALW